MIYYKILSYLPLHFTISANNQTYDFYSLKVTNLHLSTPILNSGTNLHQVQKKHILIHSCSGNNSLKGTNARNVYK